MSLFGSWHSCGSERVGVNEWFVLLFDEREVWTEKRQDVQVNCHKTLQQTLRSDSGLLKPARLFRLISMDGPFSPPTKSPRLGETGVHPLHRPTTADAVMAVGVEERSHLTFQKMALQELGNCTLGKLPNHSKRAELARALP